MQLYEYIRETLISISRGITEANGYFETPVPFKLLGGKDGTIDFEIYVDVEEKKSQKASAEIGAKGFSFLKIAVGGTKEDAKSNLNKHVLKFRVRPDERSFYKPISEK